MSTDSQTFSHAHSLTTFNTQRPQCASATVKRETKSSSLSSFKVCVMVTWHCQRSFTFARATVSRSGTLTSLARWVLLLVLGNSFELTWSFVFFPSCTTSALPASAPPCSHTRAHTYFHKHTRTHAHTHTHTHTHTHLLTLLAHALAVHAHTNTSFALVCAHAPQVLQLNTCSESNPSQMWRWDSSKEPTQKAR